MQIKQTRKRNKKPLFIALIGVLLLAGGYTAYAYSQHIFPFHQTEAVATDTSSAATNSVNYDPPTQQEIDSSQDAKKRDDSSTTSDGSSSSSGSTKTAKKTANVGISYADVYNKNLEVRAFTNSVIEGSGTCTVTAVMKDMESMKATKTVTAFIDATSTQCNPVYIPVSSLHSGTWNVTVKFSSPDYEGTSDTVQVHVP